MMTSAYWDGFMQGAEAAIVTGLVIAIVALATLALGRDMFDRDDPPSDPYQSGF